MRCFTEKEDRIVYWQEQWAIENEALNLAAKARYAMLTPEERKEQAQKAIDLLYGPKT